MNQLVQLQQSSVPVTSNEYAFNSNYNSSTTPLTITIPASSTAGQTIQSVELFYGFDSSNLQTYSHVYHNNPST